MGQFFIMVVAMVGGRLRGSGALVLVGSGVVVIDGGVGTTGVSFASPAQPVIIIAASDSFNARSFM